MSTEESSVKLSDREYFGLKYVMGNRALVPDLTRELAAKGLIQLVPDGQYVGYWELTDLGRDAFNANGAR